MDYWFFSSYFDLIVGAPYYSSNIVNEGVAYVYINQKVGNFLATFDAWENDF